MKEVAESDEDKWPDARGRIQAVVEEEEAECAYKRQRRTLTKWKIENETPLLEWNGSNGKVEKTRGNSVKGKKLRQ